MKTDDNARKQVVVDERRYTHVSSFQLFLTCVFFMLHIVFIVTELPTKMTD